MMLKRLRQYVNRVRVSHGFTVHSPFAFRFITNVLREKLPYYCFDDKLTEPSEQLLFRVANFVQPKTVAFADECPRARQVIKLACPNAVEINNIAEADFTFAISTVPTQFRSLYVVNAHGKLPSDAMTFTNRRTLIAFRRQELPSTHFSLNF